MGKDEFDAWKNRLSGSYSGGLSTDKCPRCKTDLKFRGREKNTAELMYYRYELLCPKCGKTTYVTEGKQRRYVDLGRTKGRHAGEIGEKFVQRLLVKEDYEIRSFAELASNALCKDYDQISPSSRLIGRGSAELFLGEKLHDFIQFCEAWNRDLSIPSKIRSAITCRHEEELFQTHGGGLDLVGKKSGRFYLIEVKTNRADLQDYQRKMLVEGKKFGFVPLVIRLD